MSGAPAWWAVDGSVVGIIVAPPSDAFAGRSWIADTQSVRAEFERHGIGGWLWSGDEEPLIELTRRLSSLLYDDLTRRAAARNLAAQFNVAHPDDDSAPGCAELAVFIMMEQRALATLTQWAAAGELKGHFEESLRQLIDLGRSSGSHRLLALSEHRRLLAQLSPLADKDPTLLPRAARSALPHTLLPPPLSGDEVPDRALDAAVQALEDLDISSLPGVPALLRVVEGVAARSDAQSRESLREWNDQVSRRLGLPYSALAERRADADAQQNAMARSQAPARDPRPSRRLRVYTWDADSGLTETEAGVAEVTTPAALAALEGDADVHELACRGSLPDLRPLKALPALRTLAIEDNTTLEDLDALVGCERLRSLRVHRCPRVTDLAALARTGVVFLEVSPSINVRVLETLAPARWLRVLRVGGLPADADPADLSAKLPQVSIEIWD
ncbi:hypothetical protein AB0M39_28575 [Streptomyces sp. NPDC051907]|uniref:hypothetical protein n=1 Tax=Streptomyces sp. NPDC051907 TaxID=3155284 RepID=UPI003416B8AD